MQNRFEHTIEHLYISNESLTAAESRIRDADVAKEMMGVAKYGILKQAQIAMQAQANELPGRDFSVLV